METETKSLHTDTETEKVRWTPWKEGAYSEAKDCKNIKKKFRVQVSSWQHPSNSFFLKRGTLKKALQYTNFVETCWFTLHIELGLESWTEMCMLSIFLLEKPIFLSSPLPLLLSSLPIFHYFFPPSSFLLSSIFPFLLISFPHLSFSLASLLCSPSLPTLHCPLLSSSFSSYLPPFTSPFPCTFLSYLATSVTRIIPGSAQRDQFWWGLMDIWGAGYLTLVNHMQNKFLTLPNNVLLFLFNHFYLDTGMYNTANHTRILIMHAPFQYHTHH